MKFKIFIFLLTFMNFITNVSFAYVVSPTDYIPYGWGFNFIDILWWRRWRILIVFFIVFILWKILCKLIKNRRENRTKLWESIVMNFWFVVVIVVAIIGALEVKYLYNYTKEWKIVAEPYVLQEINGFKIAKTGEMTGKEVKDVIDKMFGDAFSIELEDEDNYLKEQSENTNDLEEKKSIRDLIKIEKITYKVSDKNKQRFFPEHAKKIKEIKEKIEITVIDKEATETKLDYYSVNELNKLVNHRSIYKIEMEKENKVYVNKIKIEWISD